MDTKPSNPDAAPAIPRGPAPPAPGPGSRMAGHKHRLHRIEQFPPGIIGPKRVRLYLRAGHYVLQWWDPAAKANLSDRVDGDLVAAIMRARQIEGRLEDFR